MTLETGVKELAEAVGADVKALANDPRLTDAREWSEATVPQAEAEAGTASTRRAWTSQRVRQAIVAWFNGVSGALGRTILTRTTTAQVRSDIGLGTAATRDVGEEDGNIMPVGAFGLGGQASVTPDIGNQQHLGWRVVEGHTIGTKPSAFGSVLTVGRKTGGTAYQTFTAAGVPDLEMYGRTIKSGVATPWRELIHTGNIRTSTGQSAQYPMTQKAVTDAINARGFADASGILTATNGALSNNMSSFLSSLTFAEMRSKLDVISKQSVQALDPDTATLPDLIRALQVP